MGKLRSDVLFYCELCREHRHGDYVVGRYRFMARQDAWVALGGAEVTELRGDERIAPGELFDSRPDRPDRPPLRERHSLRCKCGNTVPVRWENLETVLYMLEQKDAHEASLALLRAVLEGLGRPGGALLEWQAATKNSAAR